MKKLALALVCFVGLAFFASCDPEVVENPEPQITVLSSDNEGEYLYNGQVVEVGVDYKYGFRTASNFETQKELAKFVVTYTSGEFSSILCDSTISGTEFVYEDMVYFTPSKEIIGSVEITATVTDVAGETNSASIKIDINKEDNLEATPLTWVRRGQNVQNAEEMAAMGLQWTGSYKDIMATIKPLDDAKMYAFIDSNTFETVTTGTEKAAFFANLLETGMPSTEYRNITTNNSSDYNDILAVINGAGEQYLIHITRADIETGEYGTQITITAEWK